MNVRWQCVRVIQCSHADKRHQRTRPCVMTPHSDETMGTAGNLLTFAAFRRCMDQCRCTSEKFHALRFDHSIKRKRSSTFALAPTTMTAMHKERFGRQAISSSAAIAATFECWLVGLSHHDRVELQSQTFVKSSSSSGTLIADRWLRRKS